MHIIKIVFCMIQYIFLVYFCAAGRTLPAVALAFGRQSLQRERDAQQGLATRIVFITFPLLENVGCHSGLLGSRPGYNGVR